MTEFSKIKKVCKILRMFSMQIYFDNDFYIKEIFIFNNSIG